MKPRFVLLLPLLAGLACGKTKEARFSPCELKTTVVLDRPVNQVGALRKEGNDYFITPAGTIDSRYLPCNLPDSLKLDSAAVRFSGTVYQTSWENGQPCCRYALELTEIRRL